jgi:hypothetical protein
MNKKAFLTIILFLTLWISASCNAKAEYDVTGVWQYTLTDQQGNTYDAGTIAFDGSPTKGTYIQINIYQINYSGKYEVSGSAIQLSGDETWQGTFSDANHLNGTWTHKDENSSGRWTATKDSP